MIRTIVSVVAGVVCWGGISQGGWMALVSALPAHFDTERFPVGWAGRTWILALSIVCSLASGALAAWIAKGDAQRAVWILAGVNLAIGIAVQSSVWSRFPVSYHLVFLALVVPLHWLGGRLVIGGANGP